MKSATSKKEFKKQLHRLGWLSSTALDGASSDYDPEDLFQIFLATKKACQHWSGRAIDFFDAFTELKEVVDRVKKRNAGSIPRKV